ncbi:MAG TPA: hypothetical protein VKJ65_11480 [Phycisphaerae bacterium]|nr:hypothetical protein [Phycisphaerae bacterium]
MRIRSFLKFRWFAVCLTLFLQYACLGDDSGVTLQTGGTQIAFSTGWEKLNQPENFFVQQRARITDGSIALSAGAFKLDLSVEQYVALGIYGLQHGPEKALEFTAKAAHIPEKEAEIAVQSKIGQQMLEQIKAASTTYSFDFLSATNIEISGASAFEVHSKMTILQSSQTIFSRQFVYQGTDPQQIVQITYASSSEDIFQDKSLIDAIKRPK